MKVYYFSFSHIPSTTANSVHVMKMCSALKENGCDVSLFSASVESKEINKDVFKLYQVKCQFPIFRKGMTTRYSLINRVSYILGSIFSVVFSKNVNLVITRDLYIAFVLSFFKPVYYEIHSPIIGSFKESIFKRLLSSTNLISIISITKSLHDYLIGKYSKAENKIIILPDGADLPGYYGDDAERDFFDDEYLHVGYIGQLYKGKGMEIISALSRLIKLEDKIRLHIVGGVSQDIDVWKKKCNSENTKFYGFVEQERAQNLIRSMDICLLPNQKVVLPSGTNDIRQNISDFTSPLKMFEYMSHGKMIIASDIPVLREILNESNSILLSPNSPDLWYQNILRLREKEVRHPFEVKARFDLEKIYSWSARVDKLLCHFARN